MDEENNPPPLSIAALNAAFEAGGDLPPTVWDEWLWGCDLAEPVSVDCILNRMHLLGLLIARYRAVKEPGLQDVCLRIPGIVHHQTNMATLTPRQLKDVVDCLQVHWSRYIEEGVHMETLLETVDACMARFGRFNNSPCSIEDVNMRDAAYEHRMNLPTIRRFVSIFCVLYRHLHLDHFAVEPESTTAEPERIRDYHLQASQETFFKLSMHSDLPPAARLLYRQDFAGFYHCISQVLYFHFPSYERAEQLSLDALMHHQDSSPVFALAPVCEMYPEINLCFEDDTPQPNTWNWFLMGKRLYLVRPDGTVLGSPNVLALLGAFVAQSASP